MINPRGYYQTPLDPSLFLWLAADKLNNVNTSLPANNSSIATWYDISGNGGLATQSSVSDQPVFKTNIANGQPGALFSQGSPSDILTVLNATYLNPTTAVTCFAVAQTTTLTPAGDSGIAGIFRKRVTSGVAPYALGQQNGNLYFIGTESNGASVTVTTPVPAINTPFVLEGYFDAAGSVSVKVNNVAAVTSALSGTIKTTFQSDLAVGQDNQFFTSRGWNGYIFEVLLYSKFLPSNQRLAIRQYLGSKYGITVS